MRFSLFLCPPKIFQQTHAAPPLRTRVPTSAGVFFLFFSGASGCDRLWQVVTLHRWATNSDWICCTPLRVTTPLPSWSLPGFFGKRGQTRHDMTYPFLVKHFGDFFDELWNRSETTEEADLTFTTIYVTKCPRQVYQMLGKILTSIKWWLYSYTKKYLT